MKFVPFMVAMRMNLMLALRLLKVLLRSFLRSLGLPNYGLSVIMIGALLLQCTSYLEMLLSLSKKKKDFDHFLILNTKVVFVLLLSQHLLL